MEVTLRGAIGTVRANFVVIVPGADTVRAVANAGGLSAAACDSRNCAQTTKGRVDARSFEEQ